MPPDDEPTETIVVVPERDYAQTLRELRRLRAEVWTLRAIVAATGALGILLPVAAAWGR